MKKLRLNKGHIEHFFEYNLFIPERMIYLGGESIDEDTSSNIIKALNLLKATNSTKQITLVINSLGGCEYDAWAIYDAIRSLKTPVKAITYGSCMSAATIIFLACKYRMIGQNCVFMLHDGTDGINSHVRNTERWGDFSKRYRKYAYKIYYEAIKKKKLRMTMKQVEEMCAFDTILTAKEAVDYGFAHKII